MVRKLGEKPELENASLHDMMQYVIDHLNVDVESDDGWLQEVHYEPENKRIELLFRNSQLAGFELEFRTGTGWDEEE